MNRSITRVLRPRAGRRLPPKLRARRVGSIAREIPGGVRSAEFEHLLSRIDEDAPIHKGNHVEIFFEGEKAVSAMIESIRESEREILIEAYIFQDDSTGHRFLEALRQAASRGVVVRVMADAWGSITTRASFWRAMRESGIDVRLFNRLFGSLLWQPFRDHRKVMVVDRRVAFTGGMNIGDAYARFFGRSGFDAMRDTHVRIEGPAAWELVAVFAESWEWAAEEASIQGSPRHAGSEDGARILVLDSRPGRGYRETAAVLAATVGAARESVWITNAYFAPHRLTVSILGQAARRGIDVRLLLPGITDVPIVRHAGHGWYARLLDRGVRIFEYQPAILHAKTVVADGFVSVIGSTNLDFRSFRFNAECNVVIMDETVGRSMRDLFERDLRDSLEIDPAEWRSRGGMRRVADRLAGLLTPLL